MGAGICVDGLEGPPPQKSCQATIEIADANGVPIPHPLRQGDRNAVSIDICNAPPEKSRRHGRPDLRWGVKGFRVAGRKLRDSQKHFRPHET